MNLPDIPMLSMLRERMSWLSARQNTLSQNVANVDTPGYTAQDIKPLSFEDLLKKSQEMQSSGAASGLAVDDPRHIQIQPQNTSDFTGYDAPDVESNPSGNSVSLEAEMIKVSDTQSQFQAASNLYAKALSMMRTAIGTP
jgi:flagellar basal-body rod protein FlgB